MGAIEAGEVVVGPLLGRGAFGRVFKGEQNAMTDHARRYQAALDGASQVLLVVEIGSAVTGLTWDWARQDDNMLVKSEEPCTWCHPRLLHTGRWRGTLVAIKTVEHSAGADVLDLADKIEREALLSTSLIHPNVITTFKVCTMMASNAQALRSAGSADADWSAANMQRASRSPQHSGSITADEGSSHRSYVDSARTFHDGGVAGPGPGSAQAPSSGTTVPEHGGGGVRLPQSPFTAAAAGGPSGTLHDSSGGSNRGGLEHAAARERGAAFDSAGGNAGRRPAAFLAEEEVFTLSPEETAAEDDAEEVRERCACGALKPDTRPGPLLKKHPAQALRTVHCKGGWHGPTPLVPNPLWQLSLGRAGGCATHCAHTR